MNNPSASIYFRPESRARWCTWCRLPGNRRFWLGELLAWPDSPSWTCLPCSNHRNEGKVGRRGRNRARTEARGGLWSAVAEASESIRAVCDRNPRRPGAWSPEKVAIIPVAEWKNAENLVMRWGGGRNWWTSKASVGRETPSAAPSPATGRGTPFFIWRVWLLR